jgi:hypothetical protein
MNVYILLDRSGSMQNLWSEALGSINGYVKALSEDTRVFLALFDSNGFDVLRNTHAGHWRPLTSAEAEPRGRTPLFDSSVRVMHRILDDGPEKAVFVVMTDGEENSSRHFKQQYVKSLTSQLEAKKYEIIFLGANFDKVGDVAVGQYGRSNEKFANMSVKGMNDFMSTTLADATRSYATVGTAINFTAEDKRKATV